MQSHICNSRLNNEHYSLSYKQVNNFILLQTLEIYKIDKILLMTFWEDSSLSQQTLMIIQNHES